MKHDIFGWCQAPLGTSRPVTLNPDYQPVLNSYWTSMGLVDPDLDLPNDRLVPPLRPRGVDVRPFRYPLSGIPAYHDTPKPATARDRNKVAYAVSRGGVNLPSALALEERRSTRSAKVSWRSSTG